jgi:hypothetical protein
MEKVVYILGAGFSAPLGLPVMSNFLIQSRDLYFSDPVKYSEFEGVFETIDKISVIKNYFNTDLFNIEEILSILDMQAKLDGATLAKPFLDYIARVIRHYTPTLHIPDNWLALEEHWFHYLFSSTKTGWWAHYGYFLSSLFGLTFQIPNGETRPVAEFPKNKSSNYSVITLNYDLILETACQYVNEMCGKQIITLQRELPILENGASVPLAKLHGSIDTDDIVPPTWSKNVAGKIATAWKMAHQILSDANHIRIIGYSLPTSDAYVKFLLKSAVVNSKDLKNIDVICLDKDGTVKKRYDEFIDFKNYRYFNVDVGEYFKTVWEQSDIEKEQLSQVVTNYLEIAHNNFVHRILSKVSGSK